LRKRIWIALFIILAFLVLLGYRNRDFFVSNKGIFYYKKGDYGMARDFLGRAASSRPHHYNTALYLSRSFWKLGQYKDARESLERFVKANPDHHRARKELAFLLFHGGMIRKASLLLREVKQKSPGNGVFSPGEKILAAALEDFTRGNPHNSLKTMDQTANFLPLEQAALHALRGLAYSGMHLFDKAADSFESSLERFRDNPLVLYHLATLYIERGKTWEGLYLLDRATSLGFEAERMFGEGQAPAPSVPGFTHPPNLPPVPVMTDLPDRFRAVEPENPVMPEGKMTLIPDDPAPVYSLYRDAGFCFDLTGGESGPYILVIEARGTKSCAIWPYIAVSVNGILQRYVYVKGEVWRYYPVNLHLLEGENTIEIAYINDSERLNPEEDRNLYLRRFYFAKEEH